MILAKNAKFVYLDLVKITLQLMINYFEEKKETFFDYKKENFSKSKKSHFFFSKGLIHAFGQKMLFFLYFNLLKIRLEIMLSVLAEKKKTCFDYKKRNFSKSKKSTFPRENPYMLLVKKCHFFSSYIWSK